MRTISAGNWLECLSNGPHGGDTFYVDVADLSEADRDYMADWIECDLASGPGTYPPRRVMEILRPFAINDSCNPDRVALRGGYGIKDDDGLCAELFETEAEARAALA